MFDWYLSWDKLIQLDSFYGLYFEIPLQGGDNTPELDHVC